jgi:hypothetical protein
MRKLPKLYRGLITGVEGHMPHADTTVKLEKNSAFVNRCATIQKLQLLTQLEILQDMLLVISHTESVNMTSAYFDYTHF